MKFIELHFSGNGESFYLNISEISIIYNIEGCGAILLRLVDPAISNAYVVKETKEEILKLIMQVSSVTTATLDSKEA
ncbi:hypothetical protein [Facklamia sp. 7083-14-GEN3]|uniref:hypothetical protein n=1 Tax=Facklamia sp. 7083-14-GEN3 TaxID=2973478 RepID=UPI00215C1BC6|nr:hypothetical protein [Facklamia sp. 7083-14-GEN3]MCR8969292.1 hypothetical protein [Facklamia sp. 7083-14-GEN3]